MESRNFKTIISKIQKKPQNLGVLFKSGFSCFQESTVEKLVRDNYIAEKLSVSSVLFDGFDSKDQTKFHQFAYIN